LATIGLEVVQVADHKRAGKILSQKRPFIRRTAKDNIQFPSLFRTKGLRAR
jgi:hypothetical protein